MNASSFILLFQWLRWHQLYNALRFIHERSLLRIVSILLCSSVVWGSLFAFCYIGLTEIQSKHVLKELLMGTVFDLLFATLTMLLIFSTGIIIYSSLFASQESAFLLTTPVPADHIFSYKLQGAIAFSSWGFILLGSPVLIAYGMVAVQGGAAWSYYASLVLFFLGFILIPGTLGALLTLVLVNLVPRDRKQLVLAVSVVLLVPLVLFVRRWISAVRSAPFGTRDWFWTIFNEMRPLSSDMMPSHWFSQGLNAAAVGNLERTIYYLVLVWSNGLFLYVLTVAASRWLYRRGYNRLASGGALRKKYGGEWLDQLVGRSLFFLDAQTRLLIIKDFRTFRRDPAQWFQIFIFLHLSVMYFWGMRHLYERDIGIEFQSAISLLTLLAVGFLACAYTGRFIYPMLSLEGRKFWILGLLPLSRDRLVWGKFAFSTMGTLLVSEFLVIFANLMLSMPWQFVAVHGLTAFVLAITLSGLSVGLGTCMPNFRESDPSKIALGLGGTLNLVACLLVLVVVIASMAGPWHFAVVSDPELADSGHWWLYLGLAVGAMIGVSAALFCLRLGTRALRRMEF